MIRSAQVAARESADRVTAAYSGRSRVELHSTDWRDPRRVGRLKRPGQSQRPSRFGIVGRSTFVARSRLDVVLYAWQPHRVNEWYQGAGITRL
jgi:hypothetical protein